MSFSHLLIAAAALSLERVWYVWIWRSPDAFRRFCTRWGFASLGGPVDALTRVFLAFKCLQLIVFLMWCYVHGDGEVLRPDQELASLSLGGILILIGQVLNLSVFYRLGKVGVFYGNKFGYSVPRCVRFPFSLLRHPQYVGTVLSIWGFFVTMRFPHDDWYALPLLQTAYYLLSARFEQ